MEFLNGDTVKLTYYYDSSLSSTDDMFITVYVNNLNAGEVKIEIEKDDSKYNNSDLEIQITENSNSPDYVGYANFDDSSGYYSGTVYTINSDEDDSSDENNEDDSSDENNEDDSSDQNYEGEMDYTESDDEQSYYIVSDVTGFETLEGVNFKIYCLETYDATSTSTTKKAWLYGTTSDTYAFKTSYSDGTTYTTNEIGSILLDDLPLGKYYLFEVGFSESKENEYNSSYSLKFQEGYNKKVTVTIEDEDGESEITITDQITDEYVYIGEATLAYKADKAYIVQWEVKNTYTSGNIHITKKDYKTEALLPGATFKFLRKADNYYENDMWLVYDGETYSYSNNVEDATSFTSDENGEINLDGISYGNYAIYETEAPDGYDLTKQTGYRDEKDDISKKYNWVHVTDKNGNNFQLKAGVTLEIEIFNKKIASIVEGIVWVDNAYNKINKYDYVYGETDQDLEGISVSLYLKDSNGDYYLAATTTTGSDGIYQFTRISQSSANTYTGGDRNLYYQDLETAYIEFEYNNEKYIVLDPFVGDDDSINSKAQEYSMTEDELDDTNLLDGETDVDGESEIQGNSNPGYAVTGTADERTYKLTDYYVDYKKTATYEEGKAEEKHYKITSINLGLLLKEDPTYSVEETLSYAYITINGFTYIYYYDQPTGQTVYDSYENVPDVVKQKDAHTYEYADQVSVYSSDIASTNAGESDMQLYLVYSIYVYNSETLKDDDVYNEQKLYLTSLTNEYDYNRMELSTDNYDNNQYTGHEQFTMWTDTTTGTASYSLFDDAGTSANNDSVYKDGIEAGQTIKTYIQFKVTDTALTQLLKGELNNDKEATTVDAIGFHEYLRTDNLWNQTEDAESRWYNGHKEEEYKYTNSESEEIIDVSGAPYYVHKSIEKEETSGALYVAIILTGTPTEEPPTEEEEPPSEDEDPQGDRTVSGTVYEDVAEEDTYTYDGTDYTTYVGNGKIDDEGEDAETNIAMGVTVELLEAITEDENEDGTIDLNDLGDTNGDGVIDLNDLEQATLYVQDTNEESGYKTEQAVTETGEDGKYSFVGVIPGYYYIRFTYGDGTQKIGYTDDDGKFVEVDCLTSIDYKSTILNTEDEDEEEGKGGAGDILKNAMEASWTDYDDANSQKTTESSLEEYYETGDTDEDSMKLLEWYKYLDSTIDFNTAIDNLNMKDSYNGYTYTEKGIYDSDNILIVKYHYSDSDNDGVEDKIDYMYEVQYIDDGSGNMIEDETIDPESVKIGEFVYNNSDGELEDIEYTRASTVYPINIQAYTPEMAISVENTELNHTENKDEHASIYDNFDLGVVKQPQTNTEITKSVVDVELTLQQGSTVLDGVDSTYVTVLDEYQQYLGIELPSDLIYGSEIEATYSIVVENTSQYDYIETDEDDYGTYYKYGTITSSTSAKTIEIGEVIDDVDSKYSLETLLGEEGTATITQTLTSEEISTTCDTPITISKLESDDSTLGENSTTTTNSITFTGWEKISKSETITIEYTVKSIINTGDDTLYTNPARITSLKLSSLTTLTSSYEWGRRSWAVITVYAATGGDMRNILYIAGAVVLIAIAFGVILIKKKII